jgi:predicted nucleotidyltransferase
MTAPTDTAQMHQALSLDEYASARGFTFPELAARLELESSDVAYVTGSILDGMGDSQSDLDLYVLTSEEGFARRRDSFADERKNQQLRRDFGIIYITAGDAEIDVECHRLQKLLELFDALDAIDPSDFDQLNKSFESLGRFERLEALELLHRCRIAKPFANEDNFSALMSRFNARKFFLWNAYHCLVQVGDIQKETKRSVKNGDYESAYLKLTRLFDVLIDAYLFSSGQSLDRWKWRLPKLRAAGRPDLLEAYLNVQLVRTEHPHDLRQFVERNLAASASIAEEIQARAKLL